MIIVADSSPLISLAILNKLNILDKIFDKIYIPTAVYNEIVQQNKPYFNELRDFSINRIRPIQNQLAVQILQKELDIGESEAIVLAIEKSVPNILIDEYKGRKVAQINELLPIGSIGVLLQAKKKGIVTEIKPELNKLIVNHRRIAQKLYDKALELADEK